jgi:hypothetical protein
LAGATKFVGKSSPCVLLVNAPVNTSVPKSVGTGDAPTSTLPIEGVKSVTACARKLTV